VELLIKVTINAYPLLKDNETFGLQCGGVRSGCKGQKEVCYQTNKLLVVKSNG